ncbi:RNA polymerase sigma factor [Cellvibrio sp.]|uniref:RNA polymerase sigma factor n=1 Tax=Cellvibrio sp. TaxID=1965322 RepID=UPI0039648419
MLANSSPDAENLSDVKTLALSLDDFLRQVERRAYRTAMLSTRRSADALDIVQDAMTKLVQHYRDRSSAEWPLLFQRILQHRIMDWHRQQTRQKKWFWQSTPEFEDEGEDIINSVVDEREQDPAELLARASDVQRVISALEQLPLRQRQAFMLRAWEGFDVAETASAMECSEGSVKTHYFRALQTIREYLGRNA